MAEEENVQNFAPPPLSRHLDGLIHWPDGKVVLATSNLTGRLWGGVLGCFKTADDAPNDDKCLASVETEAGIADVIALDQDRLMTAMDSGAIEIVRYDESQSLLVPEFYSIEHDSLVSSLSLNADQLRVVSCGYDKTIKVWDLESLISVSTFRPAHADIINQVSCSDVEPEVFISCSQDGKLLLWDLRIPKPASVLGRTFETGNPTTVCMKPASSTVYAVGDEFGGFTVRDMRKDSGLVLSVQPFFRPVFRLVFSKLNPNWLAACADETSIIVVDVSKEQAEVIYKDDSHEDFVRALSWSPKGNELWSCGWDRQVKGHAIGDCNMDSRSPNS